MTSSRRDLLIRLALPGAIVFAALVYVWIHRYGYTSVFHSGTFLYEVRHDNWSATNCVTFAPYPQFLPTALEQVGDICSPAMQDQMYSEMYHGLRESPAMVRLLRSVLHAL